MGEQRRYSKEYKIEAIKLSNKIGTKKAAEELGIPDGTLSGWRKKAKQGKIYLGAGNSTPESAMNMAEKLEMLRKKNKELEKMNKRLQEENEILAEATAFFAASRRKSGKMNG